jgi:hypothetical protein
VLIAWLALDDSSGFRGGLVRDVKRELQWSAGQRFRHLDDRSGEVGLDPIAKERVRNADSQRVVSDA